jgi:hypothetical protein
MELPTTCNEFINYIQNKNISVFHPCSDMHSIFYYVNKNYEQRDFMRIQSDIHDLVEHGKAYSKYRTKISDDLQLIYCKYMQTKSIEWISEYSNLGQTNFSNNNCIYNEDLDWLRKELSQEANKLYDLLEIRGGSANGLLRSAYINYC